MFAEDEHRRPFPKAKRGKVSSIQIVDKDILHGLATILDPMKLLGLWGEDGQPIDFTANFDNMNILIKVAAEQGVVVQLMTFEQNRAANAFYPRNANNKMRWVDAPWPLAATLAIADVLELI